MAPHLVPRVAVIGGGIAGACCSSILASHDILVDLYDQGRSGVGGRASRRETDKGEWDHGCQFFRADTPRMQAAVQGWIQEGLCHEWKGDFQADCKEADFFGLPAQPPFYVGMKGLIKGLTQREGITLREGQRVAHMERMGLKWSLFGTSGEAAFHDTVVEAKPCALGDGYDAVVLTDLSSSFGAWHRASAGVPQPFADRVRARAGARVPLFSAMLAFDSPTGVPFDAAAFARGGALWFAGRTGAKAPPGSGSAGPAGGKECWTLVSTPEYALEEITRVPMQDPATGAFLPQAPEYLAEVPGPDLLAAFRQAVSERWGVALPEPSFVGAQRWGSALPAHRGGDGIGERRTVVGVQYAAERAPLAPTRDGGGGAGVRNFVADDAAGLFQAGDMVSRCTPGFEAAALSGIEAAEYIAPLLRRRAGLP